MLTCKDCIHAEVCKDYLAYKLDKALDGIDGSEKPNGRLIDADELMKESEKEPTFLAELLHRKLRNAPTIIEAEE